MNRHFITSCAALAAVITMMPSAGAFRGWDWSEPVNIGGMINTGFDDSGPAISKDGRVLYFQTNRPAGGPNCDIWVAQRESVHHEWDWPERLDAVSTEICENSVSLSRDEHHLYFTRPLGDIWVSYRHDRTRPNWLGGTGPSRSNNQHGHALREHGKALRERQAWHLAALLLQQQAWWTG